MKITFEFDAEVDGDMPRFKVYTMTEQMAHFINAFGSHLRKKYKHHEPLEHAEPRLAEINELGDKFNQLAQEHGVSFEILDDF